MSLRQLSRRNTEEHLADAFNDALAASSGPRVLSRQNSSFLNNELDEFFDGDLLDSGSNQADEAISTDMDDARRSNRSINLKGLNVTSVDAR